MPYPSYAEHDVMYRQTPPKSYRTPKYRWLVIPAALTVAAVVAGVTLVRAQAPAPSQPAQPEAAKSPESASPSHENRFRLREGTEIVDKLGLFRMTGDRATFFTEDGTGRYVGLENLNIERISRTISENPEELQWRVTGVITEYRGGNFLLVQRAVLKNRVDEPRNNFYTSTPPAE